MSEAQTQATPEAPATPAVQTTIETSPLEKVYKDFNIEETAKSFQPQTPQAPAQPVTAQPQAPKFDPFDPNFGNNLSEHVKQVSVLNQTVSQAVERVSNLERSLIAKQTEADIKSASQVIAEKAGIKPKVAEVAMEVKAREDAKFRAIWQNRHNNPKAYNAALEALAQEAAQEYIVKQDPQLAENQRAVKVSQQQMATTTKTTEQDELSKMNPAERQAHLRRKFATGR
jgi:hypothetical protein